MNIESLIAKCARPVLFVLVLAIVTPALAYEYPLSSESIREAYFIGDSRSTETADFLKPYTHHLAMPSRGPNVAQIALETPFTQIVERAGQAVNYTALDAVREFTGKPAVFYLRITIYFTPTYNAILSSSHGGVQTRPEDFWRVSQSGFCRAARFLRIMYEENLSTLRIKAA